MTDIVTLTMNPAIDLSTSVDRVVPVRKLRCEGLRRDPGGGGINVARVVIFPVDETDADDATRNAMCGRDGPDGVCRIRTYDQLVTLARATAAKPVREAALGVLVAK